MVSEPHLADAKAGPWPFGPASSHSGFKGCRPAGRAGASPSRPSCPRHPRARFLQLGGGVRCFRAGRRPLEITVPWLAGLVLQKDAVTGFPEQAPRRGRGPGAPMAAAGSGHSPSPVGQGLRPGGSIPARTPEPGPLRQPRGSAASDAWPAGGDRACGTDWPHWERGPFSGGGGSGQAGHLVLGAAVLLGTAHRRLPDCSGHRQDAATLSLAGGRMGSVLWPRSPALSAQPGRALPGFLCLCSPMPPPPPRPPEQGEQPGWAADGK